MFHAYNICFFSKASDQKSIHIVCDQALCKIIQLLQVDVIIAIGRFAEKRAKAALKLYDVSNVKVIIRFILNIYQFNCCVLFLNTCNVL